MTDFISQGYPPDVTYLGLKRDWEDKPLIFTVQDVERAVGENTRLVIGWRIEDGIPKSVVALLVRWRDEPTGELVGERKSCELGT